MAQLNFDATNVEPDAGIAVVPAGWYNVAIDESDIKPTKDGAGMYLKLRFNILDGQYKGRKVFTQLNIRHPNAQTQEIAQRQLSAIGHSVGVLQMADSQQLHGIPFKMRVKVRPAEGAYDESNEPTAYRNINEPVEVVGSTASAAPAGGFAPPPAAAAAFTPPPAAGGAPSTFTPPPAAAAPPPPPAAPQRPTDPAQCHDNGNGTEQWFINGAWDGGSHPIPAPAAQAPVQQPWAAPQADPANPFAAPPAQAGETGAAPQPWAAPPAAAAAAPQAAPAAAPGLPQPDPNALAAAQGAAPPWAAPPAA